jgi:hypothetical protein
MMQLGSNAHINSFNLLKHNLSVVLVDDQQVQQIYYTWARVTPKIELT